MSGYEHLHPIKISLPEPKDNLKLAFLLENVFSKEECQSLIRLSEEKGYEPALVNVGGGRQILMTDVRNNDRCIIDDFDFADKLFERVKHTIPQVFKGKKLVGLNERMRYLRYYPGQDFKPHFDGSYYSPKHEKSYLTLQLYLNDSDGGQTRFYSHSNDHNILDVNPKTGQVIVFQHDILHSGCTVNSGVKYVIRTDVMYQETN